ncbi:MAG: hypothetical protein ACREQ9_17150, partial [Candidatus Binatia bacterium]
MTGKKSAGGLGAIRETLSITARETGFVRGGEALLRLNQDEGFDCPGCAWPEPKERSFAEFCENGAKHVAHEATRKRVLPAFFADHPIPKLLEASDEWLEKQGRLTEPMIKRRGSDRYGPLS